MLKIVESVKESFRIAKEIRNLHVNFYKKYWKETVVLSLIAGVVGYKLAERFARKKVLEMMTSVPEFDFEAASKPWGDSLEDEKEEES